MSYKNLQKLISEKIDTKDDVAFYTFMVSNNKLLSQNDEWYLIENCKYGHPTAFVYKFVSSFEQLSVFQVHMLQDLIEISGLQDCAMYYNAPVDKSIQRFHVHFPAFMGNMNFDKV